MTTGLAFLFATLIGVFITPDGIVVGSDTALSDLTGQVASDQKYCVTGPRSVATLQGAYLLQDTVTKDAIQLYDHFRDLCSQMDRSSEPVTLRDQAEQIANILRDDLALFLERLPAAEVVRTYSSNPVVARITVTGYGAGGPASVVVGLGIATDRPTNRWEAQVRNLSRLTFARCGVRFQGHESVVTALGKDTDVRIPSAERRNADVKKLSALMRGNCSEASIRSARSMFVQAVRLTMTLGDGFGIPKGAISLPIDIVVIPRDGPIDVTHIDSW